jgi:hypothetical protein
MGSDLRQFACQATINIRKEYQEPLSHRGSFLSVSICTSNTKGYDISDQLDALMDTEQALKNTPESKPSSRIRSPSTMSNHMAFYKVLEHSSTKAFKNPVAKAKPT